MKLPVQLQLILGHILLSGGRPYIVGGAVRDHLLGKEPKDFDVEVFDMEFEDLKKSLEQFGTTEEVGHCYAILKLFTNGHEFDFSVPRTEVSTGPGSSDFEVQRNPYASIQEAAIRRDFTVNALYYEVSSGSIFDCFTGLEDLKNGILRPVNEKTFCEDPARVLRAFRFISQLNFDSTEGLDALSDTLTDNADYIPKERFWREWYSWATKCVKPSRGLQFLNTSNWDCISRHHDLWMLHNVKQAPQYHPEGDVWTHTLHVCDEMALICEREGVTGDDKAMLMFAALCHDFGKPFTTFYDITKGRYCANGQEEAGVEPTREFLTEIGAPKAFIEKVLRLVGNHLAFTNFGLPGAGASAARRLAKRIAPASIQELTYLIEADVNGRPPLPKGLPEAAKRMVALAEEAQVILKPCEDILMGRHLIEMGLKPGKVFGALLSYAREAQEEGKFSDLQGAKSWLEAFFPTTIEIHTRKN